MRRPHVANSGIALINSALNRLLIWDWLALAVARPRGFCASHTQDQAAWTVLVLNRSLPLVNTGPYLYPMGLPRPSSPDIHMLCSEGFKGADVLLRIVAHGLYEIVQPEDYDSLRI